MKTLTRVFTVAVLALGIIAARADKNVIAGPKGGRILESTVPQAEFFVEKDRTITISFYDKDLKRVPVRDQIVTATAEAKSGKAKLEFEKKGDVLVSKSPLPEGDGYTIVVQIKASAEAKPKNHRIKYITSTCGGCNRVEYACTCDE